MSSLCCNANRILFARPSDVSFGVRPNIKTTRSIIGKNLLRQLESWTTLHDCSVMRAMIYNLRTIHILKTTTQPFLSTSAPSCSFPSRPCPCSAKQSFPIVTSSLLASSTNGCTAAHSKPTSRPRRFGFWLADESRSEIP